MKRTIITLLILAAIVPAYGQGYRTMSVWQGGNAHEYSLITLDSLVPGSYEGKAVVYYNKNTTFSKIKIDSLNLADVDSITVSVPDIESTNQRTVKELILEKAKVSFKKNTYKKVGNNNPLMGHKFGADPFGMVDGDRLYVYMTDDHLYRSTDGQPITGAWDYTDCKNVTIISSEDLVNWTDHGTQPVAGSGGPASWAGNMWAPCAAHKTINGKEQYFMYFSNNSSGIGVLKSDTPYGPWTDPIKRAMIDHNTANCSRSVVPSVYDPAVLVDDDGKAYLYFGGGIDNLDAADPRSARCVQLGDNMTSIVGTPVEIRPPCLFEDAGINKVGGKYLYSYCANFQADGGPGRGNVGYMESDNPLGPFTYIGCCSDNPGGASWAGGGGNHHHAFVEFKGKYYALYHTRTLKSAMRNDNPDINDNVELRSTCLSEMKVDTVNARFTRLTTSDLTEKGVTQIKNFDPYQTVPGTTMAWVSGVTTKYNKNTYKCTAEMKSSSWMGLSKVDFGSGAIGFTAKVKGEGILTVTTDAPGSGGIVVAIAEVNSSLVYSEVLVPLVSQVKGVVNELYITSVGNLSLESWSFIK
ncbi:MAG: family 43 glycosylhydrolase [Bacteroidaceae bacterium]|nr:family 43 glycosylhydrolase [Bacteroidaceae bacterium]